MNTLDVQARLEYARAAVAALEIDRVVGADRKSGEGYCKTSKIVSEYHTALARRRSACFVPPPSSTGTLPWQRLTAVGAVLALLAAACSDLNAGMAGGRANAELDRGDYDAAIADYSAAIKADPTLPVPYANRGLAKQSKGDIDGAIADYTEAIALNPNFADPYVNRGNARHAKGDLDGALADYDKAIALNPNFAAAYYDRAIVRQDKGDADGANADHAKAVALNPGLAGLKQPQPH